MTRIVDKTIVTEDEESVIGFKLRVADILDELISDNRLDTYNEQYVLRLTLDKVDEPSTTDRTEDE